MALWSPAHKPSHPCTHASTLYALRLIPKPIKSSLAVKALLNHPQPDYNANEIAIDPTSRQGAKQAVYTVKSSVHYIRES